MLTGGPFFLGVTLARSAYKDWKGAIDDMWVDVRIVTGIVTVVT